MTTDLWIGLALTLIAGLFSGNCMLPAKFVRKWAWENTWLIFSLVSLLVLPWGLGIVMVPELGRVYQSLPLTAFAAPVLFGAGWGIAQVLFGLSVTRLGMALGYAIIVGLGAMLGTLVPLVAKNSDVIGTSRGTLIFAGIAVMLCGIAVSARAGQMRAGSSTSKGNYAASLVMAIVCGFMAPMLNFSFAFGDSIAAKAVQLGSTPQAAGYAVWPVALFGGLIPNVAYSLYLLSKNNTWNRFGHAWIPDSLFGTLMAILWVAAVSIYGISSVYLGALGTSAGWALFQIFMIITANLSGVLTGEWRQAEQKATRMLWLGLLLLAVATALIAAGNRA